MSHTMMEGTTGEEGIGDGGGPDIPTRGANLNQGARNGGGSVVAPLSKTTRNLGPQDGGGPLVAQQTANDGS